MGDKHSIEDMILEQISSMKLRIIDNLSSNWPKSKNFVETGRLKTVMVNAAKRIKDEFNDIKFLMNPNLDDTDTVNSTSILNSLKIERLLFYASKNQFRSLNMYVDDFKGGQKRIYYIVGKSYEMVSQSPLIENLLYHGYEVIYAIEPIERYAIRRDMYFDDWELVSVHNKSLEIPEEKDLPSYKQNFESLCQTVKDILKDEVEDVLVSNRLQKSACCVITDHFSSDRYFELNPKDKIIINLNERLSKNESLIEVVKVLFGSALLASGCSLKDPLMYSDMISSIIKRDLNITASN